MGNPRLSCCQASRPSIDPISHLQSLLRKLLGAGEMEVRAPGARFHNFSSSLPEFLDFFLLERSFWWSGRQSGLVTYQMHNHPACYGQRGTPSARVLGYVACGVPISIGAGPMSADVRLGSRLPTLFDPHLTSSRPGLNPRSGLGSCPQPWRMRRRWVFRRRSTQLFVPSLGFAGRAWGFQLGDDRVLLLVLSRAWASALRVLFSGPGF